MNLRFSRPSFMIVALAVLALSGCGGGGGDVVVPGVPSGDAPATNPDWGPAKANFTFANLSDSSPANVDTFPFTGSTAMCSTLVSGANMCGLVRPNGLGTPVPASGGKCVYLNLGANENPRGFDVIYRAADGRYVQLTSKSGSVALMVGDNPKLGFGDVALHQVDGKQWLTSSTPLASAVTVTAVSPKQIQLSFNRLPMPANTGFGAVNSIALSGTATIDCDPKYDDVK